MRFLMTDEENKMLNEIVDWTGAARSSIIVMGIKLVHSFMANLRRPCEIYAKLIADAKAAGCPEDKIGIWLSLNTRAKK